jgi:hypothetical protein
VKVGDEIDLGHSKVELLTDDIVRVEIREKDMVTAKEAGQMNDAIGELSGGKEVFVMILAEDAAQFDRSAREFSASAAGTQFTKADALVVRNLAQRILANFYISFNKPLKPSRVFNSEEEAREWFGKFKKV